MAKILYCFISLQPVEVQDDRAIAKLHPDFDTPENREIMINTPTKQLLSRQAEGLQKALSENQDATKADIDKILNTISDLQNQFNNMPAQITETTTPNTLSEGQVNEFGEVI